MRLQKKRAYWSQKNPARRSGYDLFVSHTTQEKESIVFPVMEELDKLGISYFIDSHQIIWGRSLQESLSTGLKKSTFFLAFISPNYLSRKWPMLELHTALIHQLSQGSEFILPVLIGTNQQRKRIIDKIPLLMDTKHLVWENNASRIAIAVAERLIKN